MTTGLRPTGEYHNVKRRMDSVLWLKAYGSRNNLLVFVTSDAPDR